jgi:hypothetical protein
VKENSMAKKSQVKIKAHKPSTYAAIAGLAAGLAPLFPQYAAILAALGVVVGTVGVFLPDPLDRAANRGNPNEVEAP